MNRHPLKQSIYTYFSLLYS